MELITLSSNTQLYVNRSTGSIVIVPPLGASDEDFIMINQVIDIAINFLPDEPVTVDLKSTDTDSPVPIL